jgi:hypothetical protein
VGPLEQIMTYQDIRTTSGKLLQYVRSMPAVTCAVVGQKVRVDCKGLQCAGERRLLRVL